MTLTAPAQQTTTVAAAIAEVIRDRTDHLFGLMGNGNAHVISELTRSGFPFTTARHEVATVTMADAYFRATGTVAMASATYGAGFTNTLTGLAESRLARIPLVLLVGDQPEEGARFFDIDQNTICQGLDVDVITVRAATAAQQTHEAFTRAAETRSPVVLALPYNLPAEQTNTSMVSTEAPSAVAEPAPLSSTQLAQVDDAARRLLSARRPLVLSGRGVVLSDTAAGLKTIGDGLGALFMNTLTACHVVNSPWNLGIAGGFTRLQKLEYPRQADVVLVAGASMNMFQTRYGSLFSEDAQIIRIDSDPEALDPALSADVTTIRADLADVLPMLAELLAPHTTDAHRATWRDEIPEVAGPEFTANIALEVTEEHGEDSKLNPRAVFAELEHVLPQQRNLVFDGGHFMGWPAMYLSVPDPTGLIAVGTAFQSIGLGFSSASGVTVARPERTTVLVTGDGGGLMALADFETLVRATREANTRTVVLVVNDAAYGAELHQYAVKGLDDTAMVIDDVDFAAVGQALGAHGTRMNSLADLDELRNWLATHDTGVFVADITVSSSFVAEYMRESVFGQ